MAVRIERVELSKNPVSPGESFKVSVTIVTHGYLSQSRHRELEVNTYGQLKSRGCEE